MAISTRLKSVLARLARDRDGAAILEFAVAFPVILTGLVGLMELMTILFVTALMEGGLREAARFGITGYQPAGISREERIVQLVNRAGIGLLEVTAADVSLTVYSSFEDIGQPEPFTDNNPANGVYDPGEPYQDVNGNGQWDADMGVAGVGGPGDVVLYTLTYDWPLLTPLLTPFIGNGGKIPLEASLAVRNEPYPPSP